MLNVDHNLDHRFNTDGFERNASKGPNSFHRHVFPEYIYGLRADMTNPWNVNIQRDFKVKERIPAIAFRRHQPAKPFAVRRAQPEPVFHGLRLHHRADRRAQPPAPVARAAALLTVAHLHVQIR